jgi:Arc/MetJ-type ribon-helix-helix transcriptional regulator
MKSLSVKLPDALAARLRRIAKERGKSASALVKEALEDYLRRPNGPDGEEPSCYELGRDIWGSLEGPSDLSTNPKYMEGFGR